MLWPFIHTHKETKLKVFIPNVIKMCIKIRVVLKQNKVNKIAVDS